MSSTGSSLTFSLNGDTMDLDWSDVFDWNESYGQLIYDVQVGSYYAAANVVTGNIECKV